MLKESEGPRGAGRQRVSMLLSHDHRYIQNRVTQGIAQSEAGEAEHAPRMAGSMEISDGRQLPSQGWEVSDLSPRYRKAQLPGSPCPPAHQTDQRPGGQESWRVAPCEVGQNRGRVGDGPKKVVAKVNTEAQLHLNFR